MAAPIERKVKVYGGVGVVSALIIWAITTWVPGFESGVPEAVVNAINWVVPLAIGFIGAFLAKHTDRPGLPSKWVVTETARPPTPRHGEGAGDDRV